MGDLLNIRMTAEDYLTLPTTKLANHTTLSSFMDLLVELDVRGEKSYRRGRHKGLVRRYRASQRLRADPVLFDTWIKQPRVLGLPRPPKTPDDALVALLRATYADPSKASKDFKRIEHLWKSNAPASKVLAFLCRRGLQDSKRLKDKAGESEDSLQEPSIKKTLAADGNGNENPRQGVETQPKPKNVHISNLAPDYVAEKKVGDTVALAGVVLSKQGNSCVLLLKACG